MSKTRTLIKKLIYTTFGEGVYAKAYAKGKIKDIQQSSMAEAEFDFMHHFLSSTSTVLDIGANYGHYAVELAKKCPQGEIHAFEPIPFTFGILERIKVHFKLSNLQLYHAAVSDQKGLLKMNLPLLDFGAPNTGIAYIGNESSAQMKVETVATLRLDDMQFAAPIDFIKIDIEGHEPTAFAGMENLLLRDRPVILIEFSHSCLARAKEDPLQFARVIREKLNLEFTHLNGTKLATIKAETPPDGYYFLIPAEKIATYKTLFTA